MIRWRGVTPAAAEQTRAPVVPAVGTAPRPSRSRRRRTRRRTPEPLSFSRRPVGPMAGLISPVGACGHWRHRSGRGGVLLDRLYPPGQSLDRVRDRSGRCTSRRRVPPAGGLHPTGWPGLPTTVQLGHVVDDHRVGADLGAVTDPDRAEQLGSRADRHVVLHGGMALAGAKPVPRASPLVDVTLAPTSAVSRSRRHTVVDEQAGTDLGRRVDLDAGGVRAIAAIARGSKGTPIRYRALATRWASSAWTPGQVRRISGHPTPLPRDRGCGPRRHHAGSSRGADDHASTEHRG